MDYFVELADRPDIEEAIQCAGLDLSKKDPGQERRADIINRFYAQPNDAATIWEKLRYCSEYRNRLVDEILRVLEKQASDWFGYRDRTKQIESALASYDGLGTGASRLLKASAQPLASGSLMRAAQKFVNNLIDDRPDFTKSLRDALTPAAGADSAAKTRAQKLIDELMANAEERPFRPDLLEVIAVKELKNIPKEIESTIGELFRDRSRVVERAHIHRIPVPFTIVLESELDNIDARRGVKTEDKAAPIRRAMHRDLVGLTFSGGGIRSATFNLGVLQGLAKLGILHRCDYLSTVSGGGYIGGWFLAWLKRLSSGPESVGSPAQAFGELRQRLNPSKFPNPLDSRIRPIRYLREFSNYLTPQTGFFSADTWTMISIYVRNALLNQFSLILLMAAVLLTPRVLYSITEAGVASGPLWPALVALIFLLVATYTLGANLRIMDVQSDTSIKSKSEAGAKKKIKDLAPQAAQSAVQWKVVIPLFFVAWAASASYWKWLRDPIELPFHWHWPSWMGDLNDTGQRLFVGSAVLALFLLVYLIGVQIRGHYNRCWPRSERGYAFAALSLAAVGGSAVGWGLIWTVGKLFLRWDDHDSGLWHAITFGTPLALTVLSLAVVMQIGLLGYRYPDERREWWSRMRAWTLIYSFGWLGVFAFAVYAPWGYTALAANVSKRGGWIATLAWAYTTLHGLQKTNEVQRSGPKATPSRFARVLVKITPYVFILGLIVLVANIVHSILERSTHILTPMEEYTQYWKIVNAFPSGQMLAAIVLLAGIALLVSWRVGVNEFSMHHFYKNRLVRCYLGASRWKQRRANDFTGFDPEDDQPLADFSHDYAGPYPIINAALNLVKGGDLAWQERKAASFIFTPQYCGYDVDRAVLARSTPKTHADAYVPTQDFAYPGSGPKIGMAMAISGAAAASNMGKMTTPASAFLMTLFNARLGWWFGNPRRKASFGTPYWQKPSPRSGFLYSLVELFGLTNDERGFINLSDGGHFENLGVYELVRRGCRYIICCDAGQDGAFALEDLGSVVRKCRTDFGVEIDINLDLIRERSEEGWTKSHCVVGKIKYPDPHFTRPNKPVAEPCHGLLVYMKPTITGDEPFDILEYNKRVPEFPHESTADQWFNESQFESYRRLGLHISETTFQRFRQDSEAELGELFDDLFKYWYPPSTQIGESGTRLSDAYSKVMETVRKEDKLKTLDADLFQNWPNSRAHPLQRDDFYVCNALIQLMENVYFDMNLEQYWDHPHVEGWRLVFKTWSKSEAFRETWKIAGSTYAERFRNFYDEKIALK